MCSSPASDDEEVREGVRVLREGGLVAYPTDTVYGLGCDAFKTSAVDRVYSLKRREKKNPFPLLVSSVSEAFGMASLVSDDARLLMDRFWPGGLTIILHASASLPAHLRTSEGTVAVRVPDHSVALALIRGLGRPLVGTSANISGANG